MNLTAGLPLFIELPHNGVTKDRTDHTCTKNDQMKYGGLVLGLGSRSRL